MTTETTLDRPASVASDTYGPVLIPKTVEAGADLAKNTILGRVTASGKLAAYASGNIDGTENPVAVLLVDAAAAAADVEATVGFGGVYVKASMTGLDAAAELALEARGIYFI
jgi:head decoration protein D